LLETTFNYLYFKTKRSAVPQFVQKLLKREECQSAHCKSTKSIPFDKRNDIIDTMLCLNHLPQIDQILRGKTVAYAEYNAKNQMSFG